VAPPISIAGGAGSRTTENRLLDFAALAAELVPQEVGPTPGMCRLSGGQAVRNIKRTHCSIRRCPSRPPSAQGELMSEHAASREGSLGQPGFAQAVFVSGEIFRTTER